MRRVRGTSEVVAIDEHVIEAVAEGRAIVRYLPAEAGTTRRSCWLRLAYGARNPLVVSVAMCAPSKAVVFDRHLPRTELAQVLQRRVTYPELVLFPDALRGRVMFRFSENGLAVNVAVLANDVASFVVETERLVSPAAELDALNAALAVTLEDERLADTSP